MLAGEVLNSLVDIQMLVQVCLLSESHLAAGNSASIRPLIGVNTEVIEEIVPFPEHFSAVTMGAVEKPDDSAWLLLAPVLIDHEFAGRRNMLLDSNAV